MIDCFNLLIFLVALLITPCGDGICVRCFMRLTIIDLNFDKSQ